MAISSRFWRIRATDTAWYNIYPYYIYAYTIQGFTSQDVSGVDVFQNKTAYASSIYSVDYPASNAIDGNDTTFWLTPYEPASYQSWWVDLGASYQISSLKVFSQHSAGYLRWPKEFSLDYGSDGINWTELVAGISSTNTSGFQAYENLQVSGGSVGKVRLLDSFSNRLIDSGLVL